ncbi:MAG: DUF2599 domain-containing protein [Mycobacterium sp.]
MNRFRRVTAMMGIAVAVCTTTPAHADRTPDAPQYIDHVAWEYHGDRATLRIYPTMWGWHAAGVFTNGAQIYDAWAELLEDAPEANTLSMQNQFFCNWQLSKLLTPGKVGTWNIAPWRPVVTSTLMIQSGCKPGGLDDVVNDVPTVVDNGPH